jgi:molybdate transport system ATP-binding protein
VPVYKRNIGYVFQNGRLFPHLNVKNNLLYGVDKKNPSPLGFDELVAMLKLEPLLASRPGAISGGEYQRVALGRALLCAPQVLLLDEPFSAVDSHHRSQIIPYLLALQQRIALPMLVVSHEIIDLLKLTNRLCLINQGECVGHDHYERLIASASGAALLGCSSVYNALTLQVKAVDGARGLVSLCGEEQCTDVRVVCERCRQLYRVGERVKIFLKSDDITLSLQRVEGSSFQNQLPGTLVDSYERGATTVCVVDCGIQLIAEITSDSMRRLNLKKGSAVWSLFKSIALDTAL